MINLNTNHEKISHTSKCFLQNGVECLLFTNNTLYVLLFSVPQPQRARESIPRTCKYIRLQTVITKNSRKTNWFRNRVRIGKFMEVG